MGCLLLISIDIVFFDEGTEKKKKKNDQTGTQDKCNTITQDASL